MDRASDEQIDTTYFQLSIISQVPETPTLNTPPNQMIEQNLQVLLSWEAMSGTNQYDLQLSLDSTFSEVLLEETTFNNAQFALSELSPNQYLPPGQ